MSDYSPVVTRWKTLLAVSTVALLVGSCRGSVMGMACEVDEVCGSGFDCYRGTCVPVCTADDQCPQGMSCFRYHCVGPEGPKLARPAAPGTTATGAGGGRGGPEPKSNAAVSHSHSHGTPPIPDVTAAELRALRREMELLRRDVARLVKAHGLDK